LLVPPAIERPEYARPGAEKITFPRPPGPITIKNDEEVQLLRNACKIAAKVRALGGTLVKPGVTTDEVDKKLHQAIIDYGAYPSPLGYCGYPKSVCCSVDQIICHGIPNSRPLEDGDIVKIDITVYYNGFHGDCCGTFIVGETDKKGKKLVEVAREATNKGIKVCKPGVNFGEIGKAIQNYVEREHHTVITELLGHGIGREFHENGILVYHVRRNDNFYKALTMAPGMTFTIEPVITEGTSSDHSVSHDGWSLLTLDGSRGAQFEETLVITKNGFEILTVP